MVMTNLVKMFTEICASHKFGDKFRGGYIYLVNKNNKRC